MSKQQVTVPDIGGAEGAEVIEVLVAVGDEVSVDQGLIVLESDKASMEIPSTVAGTVVELLVVSGQQLAEGAPVAVIEVAQAGESAAQEKETTTAAVADEPEDTDEAPPSSAGESVAEAAKPAAPDAGSEQTVSVPDIGTDEAVELIEISVAVGDTVAEGDSLVVLESDKASMEVPAPFGGEVIELLVKAGAQVKQGDQLLVLRGDSPAVQQEAEPEAAPVTSTAPEARPKRQLPPLSRSRSRRTRNLRLPRHPASTRAPRCASWPGSSV